MVFCTLIFTPVICGLWHHFWEVLLSMTLEQMCVELYCYHLFHLVLFIISTSNFLFPFQTRRMEFKRKWERERERSTSPWYWIVSHLWLMAYYYKECFQPNKSLARGQQANTFLRIQFPVSCFEKGKCCCFGEFTTDLFWIKISQKLFHSALPLCYHCALDTSYSIFNILKFSELKQSCQKDP